MTARMNSCPLFRVASKIEAVLYVRRRERSSTLGGTEVDERKKGQKEKGEKEMYG